MHTTTHRSETVGQLVLVDVDPTRQQVNRAIAGFLAGYSGATLEAYRLDLRQWVGWLDAAGLGVFVVERAHIELYARWCESEGKAPATIGRRLSTICGFYNYCSQERLIDRNPAAHVRRPKQNYESSTLGLDRNELGAFLVQAGLSGGRDHALACLLALNGLRISEALGADIDDLDVNRGHRTLFIRRKGGKTATIPLSPRTARALDLYIGERRDRADLLEPRRHPTPRPSRLSQDRPPARQAGRDRQAHLARTRYGTRSSPPPSTLASRYETSKKQHRTPIRERRCATTEAEDPSTATPPTSSPPSSPAPAADHTERSPDVWRRDRRPARILMRVWMSRASMGRSGAAGRTRQR